MYPWLPWAMPYPPPTGKTQDQDPIRLIKKWKKFLKGEEEDDKKKKDKDKDKKKNEAFDQLLQAAAVLFVATFFVGPLVYTVWHLANK